MNWFNYLFVSLTVLFVVISAIAGAFSARNWYLGKEWVRHPQGERPFGMGRPLVIATVFAILAIGVLYFGSLLLPQTSSSASTLYRSQTDVPGLLLTVVSDEAVVKEESISITTTLRPVTPPPSSTSSLSASTDTTAAVLHNMYHPNYTFFLKAQLEASSFNVDPQEQIQQPLDQGMVSFHWTATPAQIGRQAITIVVMGVWVSKKDGKQLEGYLGSHTWYSNVADQGQTIVSLVDVIAGSSLITTILTALAPFVLDRFWGNKDRTKQVGPK